MNRGIAWHVTNVIHTNKVNSYLAISELPFAHIVSAIGFDRFTLRGKSKVNTQWNLFCIAHNVKKINRYGFGFP
jgi:hypothetical protein